MDYSSYTEAPDKFHWWTAVSIIAGALRGKVSINQGYFKWPSNFFIVFVAPPGIVQKSTTINVGVDLLQKVPDICMGPDVVTWQALATAFAQATIGHLMADGQHEPHSSITIASSEFGNLLNPSDREMVDFLVTMWDGQKRNFKKITKTSGSDLIENPWLNLIACTTPSWIAGNFPEYLIGGGFTSRTIFVYGESKRALIAYPGSVIPTGHQDRAANLLLDLTKIASLSGDFKLSRDAMAWGEVWYKDHYENHILKPTNEFIAAYNARKQTHLHKLAMILSASRGDSMVIEEIDLKNAHEALTKIEADMPKVFSKIGLNDETKAIGELLRELELRKKIKATEAYKMFHRKLTQQQFTEVVKSCTMTGNAKFYNDGTGVVIEWVPNPELATQGS
jgi:hypothetical protein